jgi:3-oxoacyl-[acyl-carrier protein] reductase
MTSSVAVITGANQGIRRATAVRLARDFSSLSLVARNRPNLEKAAARVRDAGAQALVIDVDQRPPPGLICTWRKSECSR